MHEPKKTDHHMIPIDRERIKNDALAFQGEISRIRHLYHSAMQVASTQLNILDEEFSAVYDHTPVHHLECRIKKMESIIEKLIRKGYQVTPDNFHCIQDTCTPQRQSLPAETWFLLSLAAVPSALMQTRASC